MSIENENSQRSSIAEQVKSKYANMSPVELRYQYAEGIKEMPGYDKLSFEQQQGLQFMARDQELPILDFNTVLMDEIANPGRDFFQATQPKPDVVREYVRAHHDEDSRLEYAKWFGEDYDNLSDDQKQFIAYLAKDEDLHSAEYQDMVYDEIKNPGRAVDAARQIVGKR